MLGKIYTLLLIVVSTPLLRIPSVKATGTIFIRPDGAVDPPTAPISSIDRITYTFTNNIYDEIVVQRHHINIDGAGFTLQGSGAINSTGIYLSGASYVAVKNTKIRDFFSGIKLDWSADNDIRANRIVNNDFGIWLHESINNEITANHIDGGWSGINLAWSARNSILDNNITSNEYGIQLYWSSDNEITANNVTNNGCGIDLAWSSDNDVSKNAVENSLRRGWHGIRLHSSSGNTISENRVKNSLYGVGLLYESAKNHITGNNVSDNFYGIKLSYSSNNVIHHNNFLGNTKQVESRASKNTYDQGYPSGGNYWGDYQGVDEKAGPNQDQPGSDGIGDLPYVIDADNRDRYPIIREASPLTFPIDPTFLYAAVIALAVIVAGLALYMTWRRRRKSDLDSSSEPAISGLC